METWQIVVTVLGAAFVMAGTLYAVSQEQKLLEAFMAEENEYAAFMDSLVDEAEDYANGVPVGDRHD